MSQLNFKLDANTLKFIGGAIIVAGAFAIMLPGFVSYAFGLSRILILVAVTVTLALILGQAYSRIIRRNASRQGVSSPAAEDSTVDTKSNT